MVRMKLINSSGRHVSVVELKRLQYGLTVCIALVVVYMVIQNGLLNDSFRSRRERFNSIIKNASQMTFPCQRKFWNMLYLLSGNGSPLVDKSAAHVTRPALLETILQRPNTSPRVNTTSNVKNNLHIMGNIDKNVHLTGRKNNTLNSNLTNSKASYSSGLGTILLPIDRILSGSIPSPPPHFELALKEKAKPATKEIVLSIADSTYADFAVNFFERSINKHGIENVLMVCLDRTVKLLLAKYEIDCYYFPMPINLQISDGQQMKRGDFGTPGYYLKTNIKTLVVLHALNAGYTVLLVDIDIVFLKNPFSYLTCLDCDVQMQQDRVHLNSGFVYARPTKATRALYTMAWKKYLQYRKSHDQAYINMAVGNFDNENITIKIERLSTELFPCGAFYFETPTFWRMFGDAPCKECVIVHNNYIGSTAAKRYRFKENELWSVDNEGYYSDPNTKYLVYDNPDFFGDRTVEMERSALQSALAIGNITGRVVILPRFHCCNCQRKSCSKSKQQCNLLTVLKMRTFDEVFKGKYRENSFLKHPKVPNIFKTFVNGAQCRKFIIKSTAYLTQLQNTTNNKKLIEFTPLSLEKGATEDEITTWFGNYKDDPVLNFHSLYGAFSRFSDYKFDTNFQFRIHRGFQCTSYDQWEVKDKW